LFEPRIGPDMTFGEVVDMYYEKMGVCPSFQFTLKVGHKGGHYSSRDSHFNLGGTRRHWRDMTPYHFDFERGEKFSLQLTQLAARQEGSVEGGASGS
jgi:hypothetical protein